MDNSSWIIPVVILAAIFVPIYVLIIRYIVRKNKKKKELRARLTRGAVPLVYQPEFIAELMFSVDHKRRLFRPELFEGCAIIPFSKIRSIQLTYETHVDVKVKHRGSLVRTFIGGAVMGTPGAILGACSGDPVVSSNEIHYAHKVVVKTTVPGVETLEIPFTPKSIMKIYKNGKCKHCMMTSTMEKEVQEEVAKIQRELRRKPASTTTAPARTAPDTVDELRRYRGLLDDGTITQQEFEEVKRRLLDNV